MCPKYPSMPVAYCSHCQGTTLGTLDRPRYSLKYGFDRVHGFPIVEVLKNGGSIHRYDSHFRFGRRKAEIIVACIKPFREFGWSSDEARLLFEPRVVGDETHQLEVHVSVEMQTKFRRSTGEIIDRPWLRLRAFGRDKPRIGLGVAKCRALFAVANDLRAWLDGQNRDVPLHRFTIIDETMCVPTSG